MHDVCLREIASQDTASRQLRTASDHVTDSTTTISFYLSGYFTPPALRHKSYTEPHRQSERFCSAPFNSIPACTILPTDCPWPCRSILLCFIPVCPPHTTYPARPSRPPVGTAMLCSALPVQIHSGLLTYRLTAANPCRFILLCLIPASPAIPYLPPVHTAPKPIDSVHQSQPKTHTQHISPLCDARQPIKQPTDAVGNISQSNIPLLTILKYKSLVYDRATAGYRSAPPVGCKTAARAIGRDSEDTLPLYGRYKIVMR